MKTLLKIGVFIFDLVLGLCVLILYVNLSWQFGHSIVDGTNLIGNDSPFVLSFLRWFDKFWPNIPIWLSSQGTGVSFIYSYPMLGFTWVIGASKIFGLSLAQTFRIFCFAAFPITAWGIYWLGKRITNSRAAGFLAGIFFLISQASWVFFRLHGIFAQTISLVFIPPLLLFYDRAVEGLIKGKRNIISRLDRILVSVFYALTVLGHPISGTIIGVTVVGYGFFVTLISSRKFWKDKLVLMIKVICNTGIFLICGLGLAAFWFIPFYNYTALTNRSGATIGSMSMLKELALWPMTMLGFNNFGTGDQRIDFFFFALPVLILFIPGFLLGILRNRKLLVAGIVSLAAFIYIISPLYFEFLVAPFKYFYLAVSHRAILVCLIFLPVVASGGLKEFWQLIIAWWLPKTRKMLPVVYWSGKIITSILVMAITLFSGYWMIKTFPHQPPDENIKLTSPYGVGHYDEYGPTIDENWRETLRNPANLIQLPGKVKITDDQAMAVSQFKNVVKELNLTQFDRIDVSPFVLGGAIVKQENLEVSEVSIINLYHSFAAVNRSMWGYQAGVFFGKEPIYDDPILLKQLSDWYGVNYVLAEPNMDRIANYQQAGYEKVQLQSDLYYGFTLLKYPNSTGLTELTDKPAILVIGDPKSGAYEQVFRAANYGAVPYTSAILVEGSKNIDDYTLADLENYQGIILHGYQYHSQNKAWNLINQYVQHGGNVFINTGWQYVSPQWGNKNQTPLLMPKIMPVVKTSWINLPADSLKKSHLNSQYIQNISQENFGKLDWRGEPWGLAVAESSELAKGAEKLMEVDNKILMAQGNIGKGKIVWSGFNIISHLLEYKSQEEAKLLNNIFADLWGFKADTVNIELQKIRNYPDQVDFILTKPIDRPMWFMWKENYTPEWKLMVSGKQKIPLVRAGPGFMLAKLNNLPNNSRLTLNYQQSFINSLGAKIISGITVIGLLLYLFLGKFTENLIDKIFLSRITNLFQNWSKNVQTKEKEEY